MFRTKPLNFLFSLFQKPIKTGNIWKDTFDPGYLEILLERGVIEEDEDNQNQVRFKSVIKTERRLRRELNRAIYGIICEPVILIFLDTVKKKKKKKWYQFWK